MSSQKQILEMLSVPHKDRDIQWEANFLKTLPAANISLMAQAPQAGPDQFPYMFIEIKEDSTEPAINLLKWISENGIGLAINPTKSFPDFVLTYGMIWNYIKNGLFLENSLPKAHAHSDSHDPNHKHGPNCNHGHSHEQEQSIEAGVEFYIGAPSEGFLPKPVRTVLREFLKQQGVMAPKIIMISPDKVKFDLCFSIESFGSPKAEEHEGILQALSWFLPAHYSLAFVSENGIPSFEEL
ncbi:MAG: hypothetical protein V4596_08160 [Bdellovibrionota bacterium]